MGTFPSLVIDSVQITNHTFLVLVISALSYFLISAFVQGTSNKRLVAIFICSGLAPLATLTGVIYLFPAAAAIILQRIWCWKLRIAIIFGMIASATIPLATWLLVNKKVLGVWLQPQGYPSNYVVIPFHLASTIPFILGSIENLYIQFFLGQFVTDRLLYLGVPLLVLPLVLLLFSLRPNKLKYCWHHLWSPKWMFLVSAALATVSFAFFDQILSQRAFGALGRFLGSAIVPIVVSTILLATYSIRRPLRTQLAVWLLISYGMTYLAVPQALAMIVSTSSITTRYPTNLTAGVLVTATATIPGEAVFHLDRAATDSMGNLWLHISASNIGTSIVDWYPEPQLLTSSNSTVSTHSSECSVDLLPRSKCSEWVLVGEGFNINHHPFSQITFRDVLVKNYTRVVTVSASFNWTTTNSTMP
ncbi:MAG: hypothetical protein ACP5OR_09315 [Candidatus Dormibacteria bacterium]